MGRRHEQHHPWRRFRDFVDWSVYFVELPEGTLGKTVHELKTVFITTGLWQAERRCTMAHELVHIEDGPDAPGLKAKREVRARKIAAQRLLPDVRRIADALIWAHGDLDQAADELFVDRKTLQDRLDFMSHPAERAYLSRRIAEHQHDPENDQQQEGA